MLGSGRRLRRRRRREPGLGANGQVAGSSLIGQSFDAPSTSGAALGRRGRLRRRRLRRLQPGADLPDLADTVQERIAALLEAHPGATAADIPGELVTASGSGLDPHISPAAAAFQVERVAAARRLDPARVRDLVGEHTRGRDLGFLGEPRVNVLQLNLALDTVSGR